MLRHNYWVKLKKTYQQSIRSQFDLFFRYSYSLLPISPSIPTQIKINLFAA